MRVGRELVAGLMFMAFAVAVLVFTSRYDLGTSTRMGPYYFPTLVAWILFLAGGACTVKALLAKGGTPIEPGSAMPAMVLSLGAAAFALLIDSAGLVAAIVASVGLAYLAGREFRPFEAMANALVLAVFCSVVFVYLFEVPMKVLPWSQF